MKKRVQGWLSTTRRIFPLRPAGLILLALALFVALRFSRNEADYLLNPAGLVVVALVLVSALVVVVGALRLRRSLKALAPGLPENLETTHLAATSFRVPRLRGWMLLDVRVAWVWPEEVDVALEPSGDFFEELVTPRLRGRYTRVVRRFTVEDVFGLSSVSFELSWDTSVRIAPTAARCSPSFSMSSATGDAWSHPAGRAEGDLVEMRSYAPGDSMRHVLWKTFARTRRLLVRMPERAVAPHPVNVAFMVAGAGDEPTAGVARVFLEQGMLGPDFLFSADGAAQPTSSIPEAVEQVVDSVSARGAGGSLDALAGQIDAMRLSSCIIFAPSVDGPWRERLGALIRKFSMNATVVIGVDGSAQTAATRGRLERFLFSPETTGLEPLQGLEALRSSLEGAGMRVQVVHRGTGQIL